MEGTEPRVPRRLWEIPTCPSLAGGWGGGIGGGEGTDSEGRNQEDPKKGRRGCQGRKSEQRKEELEGKTGCGGVRAAALLRAVWGNGRSEGGASF